MLIELFSLGVTAEALRANIGSKSAISHQRGTVDPKFQVEGVDPTNHSFSHEKYSKLSFVWCKIWIDLSSVLLPCTHLTDGRTEKITVTNVICLFCFKNQIVTPTPTLSITQAYSKRILAYLATLTLSRVNQ